jgi:hypothetical protein
LGEQFASFALPLFLPLAFGCAFTLTVATFPPLSDAIR